MILCVNTIEMKLERIMFSNPIRSMIRNPRNSPRHSAIAEENAEASYNFHSLPRQKKMPKQFHQRLFVFLPYINHFNNVNFISVG